MTSVCIVCINYNSYQYLASYALSVKQADFQEEDVQLTFCVVDNSTVSVDEEVLHRIEGYFDNYVYLRSENVGYFPAFSNAVNNLGIGFDYVIVSNVDLRMSGNFFSSLSGLQESQSIGVIAPAIWSEHRKADLNPKIVRRVTRDSLARTMWIFQSSLRFYIYTVLSDLKARFLRKKYEGDGHIYAPHGSLVIFTKNYFAVGGRVDYPRFLFGEEVFVGEECRRIGKKVLYAPAIKVYDHDHGSTSLEKRAFIAGEHVKSLKYLIDTYFK